MAVGAEVLVAVRVAVRVGSPVVVGVGAEDANGEEVGVSVADTGAVVGSGAQEIAINGMSDTTVNTPHDFMVAC